jgi:hypothetical protein
MSLNVVVLPRQWHTLCRSEQGRGVGAHTCYRNWDVYDLRNHLAQRIPAEYEIKRMSRVMCHEMGQFRWRYFCELEHKMLVRCRLICIHIYELRVFEYRLLRNIFRSERKEVTGGWRKLHSEGLHGLCSLPVITRVIKSRIIMRWPKRVVKYGREYKCTLAFDGKSRKTGTSCND